MTQYHDAPAAILTWGNLTLTRDTDADVPHYTYEDEDIYVGVCPAEGELWCATVETRGLQGEGEAVTPWGALRAALREAQKAVYEAGIDLTLLAAEANATEGKSHVSA